VIGRQEVERALGASEDALAEETAGTDGDYGLDHIPAGAISVGIGVQEDQDAGELVGLDDAYPALQGGNDHYRCQRD